jgi:hypothetical protein
MLLPLLLQLLLQLVVAAAMVAAAMVVAAGAATDGGHATCRNASTAYFSCRCNTCYCCCLRVS